MAFAHELLDVPLATRLGELASVLAQRLDLAVEGRRDVDEEVALGPERDPHLFDLVGLKALLQQRAERTRVARVRVDGGHRGLAHREVVGMRAAHRGIEHPARDVGDHELGLVFADHADDVAAQLEVRCQVPILVAEELDPLDAQHPGRGPLLAHPDRDQLGVFLLGVLPALPAVGDDDVSHLGSAVREAGDRTPGPEVRVVGVRRNHQHTLELGQPSVVARARHPERL